MASIENTLALISKMKKWIEENIKKVDETQVCDLGVALSNLIDVVDTEAHSRGLIEEGERCEYCEGKGCDLCNMDEDMDKLKLE